MTTKKYSLLTIFTYGLVLLSPLFFLNLDIQLRISFTTLVYIIGAVCLFFYWKKSPRFVFERSPQHPALCVLLGIVAIPLSLILQLILAQIEQRFFGQSMDSQNTQAILQVIQKNLVFLLTTVIAGPIMEEFVFRRAIFGALRDKLGFFPPAILSAVLFAIAHNDTHYLLYSGLGLFFCYLYQATGRIWTSIVAHVGMNLLVISVQFALHSVQ